MSRLADEEAYAVRADERAVEDLRRVRASRREQPWAITPPEPWTDPCSECGCRLETSEGTTCEGPDGEGCGIRLCSHCVVTRVVEIECCGEIAKTIRFLCAACAMQPQEVER